jgi:hypothetical protein
MKIFYLIIFGLFGCNDFVSVFYEVQNHREQIDSRIMIAPDMQMTLPDMQMTLPDMQINLPDMQINLPDMQMTLSDMQMTLSDMQMTLPDMQMTLPDMQMTLSDMQITLPDMQITLPDMQIDMQVNVRPDEGIDMDIFVDGWNITRLDTARHIAHLSDLEKDIIFRMNQARTNPVLFSTQFVEPMLLRYNGNTYTGLNGRNYNTTEGILAVQQCVHYLRMVQPVEALKPSEVLYQAALFHANDSRDNNLVGTVSSDGSTFAQRLSRFLSGNASIAENIMYNMNDPLEIVLQFMVNDGAMNRPNRTTLMNEIFLFIGVACTTHPTKNWICVHDYANVSQ